MAVRTRIDPIDRDIQLMISQELSPQAQARVFAQMAEQQIAEAKATNRRVLGREPRVKVTVDGKEGAPLASVRPNSVVVAEFDVLMDALAWIGEQLVKHSPVESGRYARSHRLLADGAEVAIGKSAPPASEYVFINTQPYARKLEKGASSDAPDGVYQAVATLARRFGNIANISFAYRAPQFGAIHAWAQTASATRHASLHGRRSGQAEWLRAQPAIVVNIRQ